MKFFVDKFLYYSFIIIIQLIWVFSTMATLDGTI